MNAIKLKEVLKNHTLWVKGDGGERANLRGCNLRYANLTNVDLRNANLTNADLRDANLTGADLIILSLPKYMVYVQRDSTRIGGKYRSNDDWLKWKPRDVAKTDKGADEWWKLYKPIIVAAIKAIRSIERTK